MCEDAVAEAVLQGFVKEGENLTLDHDGKDNVILINEKGEHRTHVTPRSQGIEEDLSDAKAVASPTPVKVTESLESNESPEQKEKESVESNEFISAPVASKNMVEEFFDALVKTKESIPSSEAPDNKEKESVESNESPEKVSSKEIKPHVPPASRGFEKKASDKKKRKSPASVKAKKPLESKKSSKDSVIELVGSHESSEDISSKLDSEKNHNYVKTMPLDINEDFFDVKAVVLPTTTPKEPHESNDSPYTEIGSLESGQSSTHDAEGSDDHASSFEDLSSEEVNDDRKKEDALIQ
jgi:hypothetical protein